MPQYEPRFSPPAPCVAVVIRPFVSLSPFVAADFLIDTGADATVIPRGIVDQLGLTQEGTVVSIVSVDGKLSSVPTVKLALSLLNKVFRGEFLMVDADYGIIGRDVLQSLVLKIDGPNECWEEL